ncbi:MAG: restriction endonuclease [Planctomycetota bacterium]|nr:MAG: restriction endonuclease [Planctomycetota bacterium]
MSIPEFHLLMLPLLRFAADGDEHSLADARGPLADHFSLTDEERKELLPSGQQPRFNNRVAWAKVYLGRAGLLDKTKRGHFRISDRGREVLANPPEVITLAFLRQFPSFNQFENKRSTVEESVAVQEETPEETLEAAYAKIRADLAVDLLQQVKAGTPEFFESLVLDLMVRMGYGGSNEQAASLTSPGADGGIDGIINEDRLGLDVIYLQAKRWEASVGRPEIQKFVGALYGKRAKKGVFLTTSSFTQDAIEYVATIDPKVVLIDGSRLSELMIDFNVGVSRSHVYEIKRIDSDYFADE